MPGRSPISDDLNELLGLLLSHRVEFLVVGAHAVARFTRPRFTEDLDLFIRRTGENARRVRAALEAFGFQLADVAEQGLAENPRGMLVLGNKPNQVDILNFLDGVEFDSAWARRQEGRLGGQVVSFLGREDLVATKRATGRPKDLEDLRRLGD